MNPPEAAGRTDRPRPAARRPTRRRRSIMRSGSCRYGRRESDRLTTEPGSGDAKPHGGVDRNHAFIPDPSTTRRFLTGGGRLMPFIPLLAMATLVALPAFAQSLVEFSNIEPGDVLDTVPPSFEIRFTRAVTLEQLQLTTDSGEVTDLLASGIPPRQASFAISLPELRNGDYVLLWRISGGRDDAASEEIDFIVVGFHDHSEHDHSEHPY